MLDKSTFLKTWNSLVSPEYQATSYEDISNKVANNTGLKSLYEFVNKIEQQQDLSIEATALMAMNFAKIVNESNKTIFAYNQAEYKLREIFKNFDLNNRSNLANVIPFIPSYVDDNGNIKYPVSLITWNNSLTVDWFITDVYKDTDGVVKDRLRSIEKAECVIYVALSKNTAYTFNTYATAERVARLKGVAGGSWQEQYYANDAENIRKIYFDTFDERIPRALEVDLLANALVATRTSINGFYAMDKTYDNVIPYPFIVSSNGNTPTCGYINLVRPRDDIQIRAKVVVSNSINKTYTVSFETLKEKIANAFNFTLEIGQPMSGSKIRRTLNLDELGIIDLDIEFNIANSGWVRAFQTTFNYNSSMPASTALMNFFEVTKNNIDIQPTEEGVTVSLRNNIFNYNDSVTTNEQVDPEFKPVFSI